MSLRSVRCLGALLCALFLAAAPVHAKPGAALTPPDVGALTLDGRLSEKGWASAVSLPCPAVQVPGLEGPRTVTPTLSLGSSAGRLVLGARVSEPAGSAIGLHVMIAPADAKSAAEAVSIDFRPVELRAPRFHAIGPKGVGLAHYRCEGRADLATTDSWSVEVAVPWADLVTSKTDKLRIAVVVYTRTANVTSTWPAGALWKSPAHWNEVTPPAAGWALDAKVNALALSQAEDADKAHMAAWLKFLQGSFAGIDPRKSQKAVLAAFEKQVAAPLREIVKLRPQLTAPVLTLLGDAYYRLGRRDASAATFRAALAAAPGWREALYGLHVKLGGVRWSEGRADDATDYAARFAALAKAGVDGGSWEARGNRIGRALLHYKHGDFDAALPVLQTFAKRYAFDVFLETHVRFATSGRGAARAAAQRAIREKDVVHPKAVLKTNRGTIVIELQGRVAQNTVRNFVYLAQKKFYDGLAVHRTVPFFLVQMGDPNTRQGAADPGAAGTGTPGYAIPSEKTPLPMLRGAVVMASAGKDTEGSQFYILTGTAVHLQGEQTVFGRVIEGQDVAEALRKGDRIESVSVRDLDPQERYVPITVAGREPK